MFAAAAALQTASPTLVPAIAVGTLPYGVAAGAPAVASVPNAAGMVDLFNSASSLAGGALANASDAALFEAYYKANLTLHAAAARPTMTSGLATGKVAANLLGKNLASQLRPTAADLTRYGITTTTPAKLSSIANTLITTAKAFALNLTSHVMMPAFQDDPHGAFQDMATLTATVQCVRQDARRVHGRLHGDRRPDVRGTQDRRQPGHGVERRHDQGRDGAGGLAGRHDAATTTCCT